MADSIIVGQFVGSSALAAVGACAALTNVFICVALGAGVGAGVLVSRYLCFMINILQRISSHIMCLNASRIYAGSIL